MRQAGPSLTGPSVRWPRWGTCWWSTTPLSARLSGPFQIETLYRFNKKFAPAWQPRYLAVETPEELPRIVIAALRAEGLLPAVPWRLARLRPHRAVAREEALPKPPPEPPAPMPDRK
jgi:hypothetical protein